MRKEWLLWVRFYTELKQTVLNSWYVKAMLVRRGETRRGDLPDPYP